MLSATPSFGVHAPDFDDAQSPTHFILHLNDGGKVLFLLDHSPKVVNGDGFITVCDGNDTLEYPLDNVFKYTMGIEESTDVKEVLNPETGSIRPHAGMILISDFEAGAEVIVSNLSGSVVFSGATNRDGNLSVDMAGYPEGVYVIKAQNQTFKFIKR